MESRAMCNLQLLKLDVSSLCSYGVVKVIFDTPLVTVMAKLLVLGFTGCK